MRVRRAIRIVGKVLLLPLKYMLYAVSWMLPRRSGLWVFGSRKDAFGDNPKYFFLWLHLNTPEVELVWISGDPALVSRLRRLGYVAHHRWSLAGMWLCLRAGVYVFSGYSSDINFWTSGGAVTVNMWHGVGIKNVEFGIKSGPLRRRFGRSLWNPQRLVAPDQFARPRLFVSTSKTMSAHFARCFRIPVSRCIECGYARIDVLFDRSLRREAWRCERTYESWLERFGRYKRVLVYMPTWRDGGGWRVSEAFPDLARLNAVLSRTATLLVIKPHIAMEFESATDLSNVAYWPANLDLYPVLSETHGLITDYSSILYDYICMQEKDVILYVYDLERYTSDQRDLAFPYRENVVGTWVQSFGDLCSVLGSPCVPRPPQSDVHRIREKFWGDTVGGACARLRREIDRTSGRPVDPDELQVRG